MEKEKERLSWFFKINMALHGAFSICFLSGERTDAYAEPQNAEKTASKMFF